MDYIGILKRAWDVTWRHKILWLFGLFAGVGSGVNLSSGGGGSGGGGTGGDGTSAQSMQQALATLREQAEAALPVLVAFIVLFSLVALVFFVLMCVAQGGLVHLVNEAEEKRSVKAGDGWSVGFGRFWRVLAVNLVVGLPQLAVFGVYLALFWSTIVGIVVGTSAGDAGVAAAVAAAGGLCFGTVLFAVIATAMNILLGITGELAMRYAVLEDRPAWESVKQGWADIWAKRGGFLMFLVMMVTRLLYGVAIGIVVGVLVAPAAVLFIVGNVFGGVALLVVAMFVAMVPAAIYGAFISASWTIFFRQMTDMERAEVPIAAPQAPPAAPADALQAPIPQAPPMPEPPPMPEAPAIPQAPPMPGAIAEAVPEAVAPPPAEPPAPSEGA